MGKINYSQLFTIQKRLESQLRIICPNIDHRSGIYFYTRHEEDKSFAYIGKSVDVLQRNVSHLQGYAQRIDVSLKKRGFYSDSNKLGWKLSVIYFAPSILDEKEQYYIKMYQENGYELYNKESGGTKGKTIINERKSPKTYSDGLKQGYLKAQKEVKKLFDKNLVYSINGTTNKNKEKSFKKFTDFISNNESDK